jgi:hypothetical protein
MSCNPSNNQIIPFGQPGQQPYYPTLSTYDILLPVNSNNHVTSYTNAFTVFRFYIGNVQQNVDVSHITITPSTGGNISYTAANEVGGKGVVITITNLIDGVSSQALTISYTLNSNTYAQVLTVGKSVDIHVQYANVYSDPTNTIVVIDVNSQTQVLRQITIPANTMIDSGDVVHIQAIFYGNPVNGNNSFLGIKINNNIVVQGYMSGGVEVDDAYTLDVWMDKDNDIVRNEFLMNPVPNEITPLNCYISATNEYNYLQVDWTIDNVISFYTTTNNTGSKITSMALVNATVHYENNVNNF